MGYTWGIEWLDILLRLLGLLRLVVENIFKSAVLYFLGCGLYTLDDGSNHKSSLEQTCC